MVKFIEETDFVKLGKAVLEDQNITKLTPETMELHTQYVSIDKVSLDDKIYWSYMLFNLANELAKKYNEHYELNVLYDIDLLKFIIYYYVKASKNITDEENNLMVLLNNNRDKINHFDFSNGFYDQTNNVINVQSKIYQFMKKK